MSRYNFAYKNTHHCTVKKTRHGIKGFTIIEMLICVSITATLSSMAIPSFMSMTNNAHIRTSSISLSTLLKLSRNHALSTGKTVIVCHSKDSSMTQCSAKRKSNTNWLNGIISYADINNNNTLDDKDQILTVVKHNTKVSMVFNQNGRLRFFADGRARSAGFYLCSRSSTEERHLKILYTGRTRTVSEMSENHREKCLSQAE